MVSCCLVIIMFLLVLFRVFSHPKTLLLLTPASNITSPSSSPSISRGTPIIGLRTYNHKNKTDKDQNKNKDEDKKKNRYSNKYEEELSEMGAVAASNVRVSVQVKGSSGDRDNKSDGGEEDGDD